MVSDLRIPIALQHVRNVEGDVAEICDRIANRAYEKFMNRGASRGYELDDWLSAETELIFKPRVGFRIKDKHLVAEVFIPNLDPLGLSVMITRHEMLVLSDPDVRGRRVFQMVHFEYEIEPDGVKAEYIVSTLHVVASIADCGSLTRDRQVA